MKKIYLFDTTLRDGEQSPGCSMSLKEKLDVATALEALGIDTVEAGFPVASQGDYTAVNEIAKLLKNTEVVGLSRILEKDIDLTLEAIRPAVLPKLHIFIATSPIHLRYKLHMSEDDVLDAIAKFTRYARNKIDNVEFSFEDASRTPLNFLAKAADVAIAAGAGTVNFPDTVGYCTPLDVAETFKYLAENVENRHKARFSFHAHNDLGMAVANSVVAVANGADQIEGTINGIGERAGNAALEEVAMALKTRTGFLEVETSMVTERIYATSKLVAATVGAKIPPTKPIVGANAFAHASGIHQHGMLSDKSTYEIMTPEEVGIPQSKLVLGKHSGRHAFQELLVTMGYNLSEKELEVHFERFKELADRKKDITRRDIEALLADFRRNQTDFGHFALEAFDINSFKGGASAEITLRASGGKVFSEKSSGDGPVDAAFKAISSIIGADFKLDDYSVHSVTEGKDALGEAAVKLSRNGVQRTGRGLSTDVLEASIIAYLDAANKFFAESEDKA